jgi:hypothetical protein
VRAVLLLLFAVGVMPAAAWAESPAIVGTPAAAFAGGPIRLSRTAITVLKEQYRGDQVPLIPQPFRHELDTALFRHDGRRVDAVTKQLAAAHGETAVLAWEQSRFLATGGLSIAERHAEDLAATGTVGLREAAVMLWFYAAAAILTDGSKCADPTARDARLDDLRGSRFAAVVADLRALAPDRVAAMRDVAIRLERVLAPERTDDTLCRGGTARPALKPASTWRPEAAATRAMLPRHLLALTAIERRGPARDTAAASPVTALTTPRNGTATAPRRALTATPAAAHVPPGSMTTAQGANAPARPATVGPTANAPPGLVATVPTGNVPTGPTASAAAASAAIAAAAAATPSQTRESPTPMAPPAPDLTGFDPGETELLPPEPERQR